MKTSFCIPVSYKHAHFLSEIFKNISEFSEKPDEIVISVSETLNEMATINEINSANTCNIKINLQITKQKLTAGSNRNVCIKNAENDLIIFHDADDISHPDRIKIIKSLFQNTAKFLVSTKSIERTESLTEYFQDYRGIHTTKIR